MAKLVRTASRLSLAWDVYQFLLWLVGNTGSTALLLSLVEALKTAPLEAKALLWMSVAAAWALAVSLLYPWLPLSRLWSSERAKPGHLAFTGMAPDGRAIYKAGDKIIEFDTWAHEYFQACDGSEAARISRAVAVGRKTKFNQYDLAEIVAGRPVDDDRVYPVTTGIFGTPRRTRFWTRAAIAALPSAERDPMLLINTEMRLWLHGQSWSDSLRLLTEGRSVVEQRLERDAERAHDPLGLGTVAQSVVPSLAPPTAPSFSVGFRAWLDRVQEHLR